MLLHAPSVAAQTVAAARNARIRDEPDLSRLPMPPESRQRFMAAIKRRVEPIARTAILYRAGSKILPGSTTIAEAGHRPGMAALLIHSGGDQLLVASDAACDPLLNMERLRREAPISLRLP
ncbi:MBL fold metallo-hydrolase [Teichococcus vastitatis]|uniref:hypothetical protein n=1 Tax=Teichococcus vastitatis TaxID=2307076 RepID=UPI001300BC0A|nr:hypothetical protein [Pseudoroseomonas vastitatis]